MLKKEAQREGGRECGLVIAICGGKGTGKSTFGRYLAHRFLASLPPALPPALPPSVAYLDCDVGQPELTPSGLVSLSLLSNSLPPSTFPLLGPPHTHCSFPSSLPPSLTPSLPLLSFFLGDITPRHDPSLFVRAVRELKAKHLTLPPSLPLLVNMDGWVRGLGLELMRMLLCDLLAPDVVVKMEVRRGKETGGAGGRQGRRVGREERKERGRVAFVMPRTIE